MKKQDVISGLVLLGISGALYSQTLGSGEGLFADDISPMAYPRILIGVLAALGALIAGAGLLAREGNCKTAIPIFSSRTTGAGGVLIAYAVAFPVLGFALSSFLAASGIAVCMGWRRLPALLAVNIVSIAVIRSLFTYVLNIPLPAGVLF